MGKYLNSAFLRHLPGRRKAAPTQRVALMPGAARLELVASDSGGILASLSADCQRDAPEQLEALINAFLLQHDLSAPACTVVLPPGSYQMFLVEAPPVPAEELAQALRWKVKDLLHGPVEEMIVDGFLLPDDAYRGRQKMAYAIATAKPRLQQLVDRLLALELRVDRVLIPELIASELAAERFASAQPEMLVCIGGDESFMTAIADDAVYLTRKLQITESDLAGISAASDGRSAASEAFVLELQRSRDYFESQLGKGVIGRLLLVEPANEGAELLKLVEENLRLNVEVVNPADASGVPLNTDVSLTGAGQLLLATVSKAA